MTTDKRTDKQGVSNPDEFFDEITKDIVIDLSMDATETATPAIEWKITDAPANANSPASIELAQQTGKKHSLALTVIAISALLLAAMYYFANQTAVPPAPPAAQTATTSDATGLKLNIARPWLELGAHYDTWDDLKSDTEELAPKTEK